MFLKDFLHIERITQQSSKIRVDYIRKKYSQLINLSTSIKCHLKQKFDTIFAF